MAEAVRIEGLRELERAFKLYRRGMEKTLREAMENGAEPVRQGAQALAVQNITKIGIPWSRMRVGVTRRTAYVAPVERGRNTKRNEIFRQRYARPNLKDKLLDEALEPSLEQNIGRVAGEFEDGLADLARMWSRV